MEINRIGVGKQHIGCLRPVAKATPIQSSFFLTEIINFWVPGYPSDQFVKKTFFSRFCTFAHTLFGKDFFPGLATQKTIRRSGVSATMFRSLTRSLAFCTVFCSHFVGFI